MVDWLLTRRKGGVGRRETEDISQERGEKNSPLLSQLRRGKREKMRGRGEGGPCRTSPLVSLLLRKVEGMA